MSAVPLMPLAQLCALLESLPPISRPVAEFHAQGVTLCWGYGNSIKRSYPHLSDAAFALAQRLPQHHFGLGHQGEGVLELNLSQATEVSRHLARGGRVRWTSREAALLHQAGHWPLDPRTLSGEFHSQAAASAAWARARALH
ncbi:hypothetical protein Dxin01_00793 [Deinococcus xinjiangensis]|uniref:Uncharacterized protein n=1 Tax=Deinococcus xinjiangensis TaxID=457454 RepID=A0ABP9V707_9DEIO